MFGILRKNRGISISVLILHSKLAARRSRKSFLKRLSLIKQKKIKVF